MTLDQFPAKFGKYILLDRLNAGGMAEVYVAKASGVEGFERLVAIKCMLPALATDGQFTAMFVDEARLAAQVAHANVVQIYELGRHAERLYIAMELVHGRDLRHIIRTAQMANVQLPAAFSAYVISKAAEGLDYAHRRLNKDGSPLGLVHRDVSPQNILVSYDGEVKVVDFGIAKAAVEVRSTQTQVGVLKGKFAYMSPEQVMGEAIDRRADIFALGAVLFEAVSGQRLFTGDNDLVVLERVRDAVLPNMRALMPNEAERTLPVLNRALNLLPDMRYNYASEMAEALEPMLIEDQTIFGAKRAASVMRNLYRADIEQNTALLRSYADITPDNCVYEIAGGRANDADPVVYESTFMGRTPTAPPSADDHQQSLAVPSSTTTILTGGHELQQPPPQNTATGLRRPVTLTRRNTHAPSSTEPAVKRHQLDALAVTESVYEPLRPVSSATAHEPRSTQPQDAAQHVIDLPNRASVRRALWRMRIVFVFFLVLTLGLCIMVNASMEEPFTPSSLRDAIAQLHPMQKAQHGFQAFLKWRPVEEWLFGHDKRDEPTAFAKQLAKKQARQQSKPSEAAEAIDEANAPLAIGFVSIDTANHVQALVRIDDGEPKWAPMTAEPVAIGHHTVHAERHRSNGKLETRDVEFDVGPEHTADLPVAVTIKF